MKNHSRQIIKDERIPVLEIMHKECMCLFRPSLTPPELKVMIPKMAQMLNHGRKSEMERIFDRRAFLKLAGLGTAALTGSSASPMVGNTIDQGFYRTSQTKLMMDTSVNNERSVRGQPAVMPC